MPNKWLAAGLADSEKAVAAVLFKAQRVDPNTATQRISGSGFPQENKAGLLNRLGLQQRT